MTKRYSNSDDKRLLTTSLQTVN